MFVSLLKERVQQLHNSVEKLTEVTGLGRQIQVSEDPTSCTFEIPLLLERARLAAGYPEPAGTQWGAACWPQHSPTTLRH